MKKYKKKKTQHEQIEKQVTYADKYAQSGTHTHQTSTCTSPHTQLHTHTMCHGATFGLGSRFIRHTTDGRSVFRPTEITVSVTQS